jgi:hypothetical protein
MATSDSLAISCEPACVYSSRFIETSFSIGHCQIGLLKLLYAGMWNASERWTHPVQNWNLTLSQLSIHFAGRLDAHIDL